MDHASLPKLICNPINTSKTCPSDFTTLTDVLQSDPVKRLFNQPNIIIKTMPIKVNPTSASNNKISTNKVHDTEYISNINKTKQSELSVMPLQKNQEENIDDENLLPSKKQGKSEITLVPVKREKKSCGHYEPCENIICDVIVQQYVDRDRLSPMLAFNIEDNEINAPVSKHCKNNMCDALSIDHDRCRRAIIILNKCNRSSTCDICGVTLKTQRSRVHHRNCTRRNVYRHNETSSAQILKERMREREIQIIEASKIKKNDYTDPIMGYNLAMETLKNNKELIITPRSVPLQQQQQRRRQPFPSASLTTTTTTTTITITKNSTSTTESTSQISDVNNVFGELSTNIPIVIPQQSIIIGKAQCSNENGISTPIQLALSEGLDKSLITTTIAPLAENHLLAFTTQTNTHPVPINDLLLSQSQTVTTPIRPKPFFTPVRIVPITNLITQPSLLHQTQGIPKFCIMADNTAPPLTNPQSVQYSAPVPKVESATDSKTISQKKKKKSKMVKKKWRHKNKDFKCDYCLKSFSTDWYFKVHVAKHTNEKQFTCKMCKQSFSNKCDMKRHMSNHRKSEDSVPSTCNRQASACSRIVKVPFNVIETKVINLDLQQEVRKEDKTNGYVNIPNQDIVKNIKTELCHEV
ncbi:hypothetical protein WN51_06209 [Melipona quadrifasciata]|uniref:C2H2-type domain-containing protein n=1 Tax=Melipona quadrifasciata TaxID=166423 RepID=A0A0N0BDB4_9HYME|nr:hypothetical protein WN51_06209 [Melipona quadrifasciata]